MALQQYICVNCGVVQEKVMEIGRPAPIVRCECGKYALLDKTPQRMGFRTDHTMTMQ